MQAQLYIQVWVVMVCPYEGPAVHTNVGSDGIQLFEELRVPVRM